MKYCASIFFLLIFLVSCTTPSSQKLVSVAADSDIYFVSGRVNDLCLSSKDPQFLTEFSSLGTGTDFQLEGVWKNNYSILNMQVLGVFGEQYAYFELNDHKINVFSARKNILANPEIKNLINFISSIGSHELRNIFCGSYAFKQDKINNTIFVKDNVSSKNDTFFTKNEQEIDGHSIEVQSDLELVDSADDDEGYDLTIKSKFLYGFFGSNTNLEVDWMGYVDEDEVTPKIINFNYENKQYELKILDYN